MTSKVSFLFAMLLLTACRSETHSVDPSPAPTSPQAPAAAAEPKYEFVGGFPTPATVQKAYDDADLNRAIQAYKFFFPSVSILASYKANEKLGLVANRIGVLMKGNPHQVVFTPNSDTPYGGINVDVTNGPVVVEIPAGAVMSVVNDLNQRWVIDLGLPGPDAGKGGKHLILPPGYTGKVPAGYFTGTPTTSRVLLLVRAIPPQGDAEKAVEKLKEVKVYPLDKPKDSAEFQWISLGEKPADLSLGPWERKLDYWQELHGLIDAEPPYEAYRFYYGELAALGIEKGKPFAPDERLKGILVKAAELANDQLRVQSFADRTPEALAWADRKWEWATLRPENGTFDLPYRADLTAREKWFFQAQLESPAMFRRTAAAGSLYWLGLRDKSGAYLDGKKTYKLSVPLPVPAKLFWSITVYDPDTRSEVLTAQNRAALRSLAELKDLGDAKSVDLYFGPTAPPGQEARWVQTLPEKGFFTYFRIYGPEAPAFDGSWKPGDFEPQ